MWCQGMGIPAGTQEKRPSSEGAGESGMLCCRGGARKEREGAISVFETLRFPSFSQVLQQDCQEQTRFVSPAALMPRGWAQPSHQQLLAAPSKPSSSNEHHFPY